MPDAYKRLGKAQAGSSAATLFTNGSGGTWIIRHIRAVNTDTAERTIHLWDDGTTDADKILGGVAIAADGTYTEDCFICVANGDTIAGMSDAATQVTVTIYGVEVT